MRSFAGRDILSLKEFERNEFFHGSQDPGHRLVPGEWRSNGPDHQPREHRAGAQRRNRHLDCERIKAAGAAHLT